MDTLAIISDIHGNIPALEAVLADIRSRKVQSIICLGDLAGKGPESSEAVDLIRETCDVVIQGNWDDFISDATDYSTLQWHQDQLGEERMAYLKSLPFHHDFWISGKRVRLFHASAKSVHHRVQPSHSEEERLAMFDNTDQTDNLFDGQTPNVVGYADIHSAYLQHPDFRTLFNVGSVGNPLDIPESSYVLMSGNYGETSPAPFSIEFVRVAYDIEESIRRAREVEMPELQPYIHELRTAVYRGQQG
ncbi:MAG TPA: metallophosphoesterase family protein [Bacillales bacterium]